MKPLSLVVAFCMTPGLIACGDDGSTDATPAGATPAKSSAEAKERPQPKVRVPDGPPPKELVVEDLIEGSGVVAKAGDQVAIHYVGVNYRTGEEFEASRRSLPFPFRLGTGEVLEGWDRGLVGMRVGGRRELIVPSDLAYKTGALIYVIDLVSVK